MRRYIQHEPFNIYCFESSVWEHPVHNHTYFEIIFILKGRGTHDINGNKFKYSAGDVFLLGPDDYHSFKIVARTQYCYIRFTESFFRFDVTNQDKRWQQTIKLLLLTPFQSKGSIVKDKREKKQLHYLLTVLLSEYENRHQTAYEVMRDSLMKALMTILSRNLIKEVLPKRIKSKSSTSLVESMLLYIRQNICNREKLTINHLSEKFNYAPAYLSIYFKKHTGEPIKQHILKYKIKLIETRLLYSQLTLAEISDEFGFTDESHLCKQFRKYIGFAPGDFRSKHQGKQN